MLRRTLSPQWERLVHLQVFMTPQAKRKQNFQRTISYSEWRRKTMVITPVTINISFTRSTIYLWNALNKQRYNTKMKVEKRSVLYFRWIEEKSCNGYNQKLEACLACLGKPHSISHRKKMEYFYENGMSYVKPHFLVVGWVHIFSNACSYLFRNSQIIKHIRNNTGMMSVCVTFGITPQKTTSAASLRTSNRDSLCKVLLLNFNLPTQQCQRNISSLLSLSGSILCWRKAYQLRLRI